MSDHPLILRARHVAPIAFPLIADGAVRIERGRVVEVGRFAEMRRDRAAVEDLGDVVLMPGLVNGHTHLELSHATPGPRPTSFGAWALGMVRMHATPPTDDAIAAATRDGAAESLRFGVTTVGDVTRSPGVTRATLATLSIGDVSFGEVRAMGRRRPNLRPMLDAATDPRAATDRLRIGVSPHAPYSVEPDAYRACVKAAEDRALAICTHLAESPDEATFLNAHAGPLRAVWDEIDAWDDGVPRWSGSPVAFAKSVGVLHLPALLAHVNYATDADLDLIADGDASVVWCPRTHAYFGHAPHRWREMLARGINVCVGTDSRASAPDLNVVDDLRLVYRQAPDVDPGQLWQMVTTRAARALGVRDVGAIDRHMRADLVAFAATSDDPLREVLEADSLPLRVWVGGERIGTQPRP